MIDEFSGGVSIVYEPSEMSGSVQGHSTGTNPMGVILVKRITHAEC